MNRTPNEKTVEAIKAAERGEVRPLEIPDFKEPDLLKQLEELLNVAKCPSCDGSGAYVVTSTGLKCCGYGTASGECCGDPVPDSIEEIQACQWCYEKKALLERLKGMKLIASTWDCAYCQDPIPTGAELPATPDPESEPVCGYCALMSTLMAKTALPCTITDLPETF